MNKLQHLWHQHNGKLTGHVAACLTVAGPGATNLTTGLYGLNVTYFF
jgi:hypothetical protein